MLSYHFVFCSVDNYFVHLLSGMIPFTEKCKKDAREKWNNWWCKLFRSQGKMFKIANAKLLACRGLFSKRDYRMILDQVQQVMWNSKFKCEIWIFLMEIYKPNPRILVML